MMKRYHLSMSPPCGLRSATCGRNDRRISLPSLVRRTVYPQIALIVKAREICRVRCAHYTIAARIGNGAQRAPYGTKKWKSAVIARSHKRRSNLFFRQRLLRCARNDAMPWLFRRPLTQPAGTRLLPWPSQWELRLSGRSDNGPPQRRSSQPRALLG
jgi:hypothetical protein